MTEQKHTPGKWEVAPSGKAVGVNYGDPAEQSTICTLHGHPDHNETRANAALIARAPELLSENASLLSRLEEAEKEVQRLKTLINSHYGGGFTDQDQTVSALRESLRIERVECDALRDRNAVLTQSMDLILAISKKYDQEDFNKISQVVRLCFEHTAALRDSGEPA